VLVLKGGSNVPPRVCVDGDVLMSHLMLLRFYPGLSAGYCRMGVDVGVERVEAYLPYISEGGLRKGLDIEIGGLSGLAVIVGRNASGKTALLESLGYGVSLLGRESVIASTLAMISVGLSEAFVADLWRGNESAAVLFIMVSDPFRLREMLDDMRHSEIGRKVLSDEVYRRATNDSSYILGGLRAVGEERKRERHRAFSLGLLNVLEFDSLPRVVERILGRGYDTYFFSPWAGRRSPLSLFRIRGVYLAYGIRSGRPLPRAIVFDTVEGLLVAAMPGQRHFEGSVVVFHPGFAYNPGMFVSLYKESAERGFPSEREAVRLLRDFIPWFDGFELIGRELHVRSRYGRRISVRRLSDGQRAAVLLGLLYAASPHGSLVLIDTPEAFVHPDGLETVAELVARIVAEGNQAVVATQSAEMLREMLRAAKKEGILNDTVVKHVWLRGGRVTAKGSWRGEDALGMVEELAIDLRRA